MFGDDLCFLLGKYLVLHCRSLRRSCINHSICSLSIEMKTMIVIVDIEDAHKMGKIKKMSVFPLWKINMNLKRC